jgi:hypothetical protein
MLSRKKPPEDDTAKRLAAAEHRIEEVAKRLDRVVWQLTRATSFTEWTAEEAIANGYDR